VQRLKALTLCAAALLAAGAEAKDKIEENRETVYLARDFVFVESPAIEAYLRGICQRLLDAKGLKLEVPNILVQSSDGFNAFVDAKQNLIISTGALRAMTSEDELAALLGHELSHLILDHPKDKDALRTLPLGMETMAAVRDASAELKGQKATYSSDLTKYSQDGLTNSQATNMVWSDFIAPSWNRNQESAADLNGFELMRAAGYDPGAFGELFTQLNDAEIKRTQRMQVLKKMLVAKTAVVDDAAEKLVDGLGMFNRSYASPDERQTALANYANAHREKKRAPRPAVHLTETLQEGEGGQLMALDAAAINTLNALASHKQGVAKIAVEGLLGAGSALPSPHLNLAMGSFNEISGDREASEQAAQAWRASTRPPAQAYLWVASNQARVRDVQGALETLQDGRKRVGDAAPFLPNLVGMAREAGDMPLARDYAQECKEASNDSAADKLRSVLSEQSTPTGLYAECLRQLREKPVQDQLTHEAIGKARDLFKLKKKS
jgi:Zn-dependent protease with chaperone function